MHRTRMSNAIAAALHRYKNAYTGHPKEIWALFVVTLINRAGTMVLLFLSVYLTTVLRFPLPEAGLLAGAFGIGSLGGAYLGGKLSDRFGPIRVISGSLLLGGLFFIFLQFATAFATLYALILLTALFGEAYRPALTASVAEYVPPQKVGRTMAFIRLAINLGMSAAPAIGGFVAASLGYRFLFWIDGLTCIAAALFFIWTSRHWENRHVSKKAGGAANTATLPARKNRLYLKFLLASITLGFCFIQWFQSVPVFLKTEWGFDERYIGILMMVSCLLITVIEMPLVDAIEKSGRVQSAVNWGLALIGLSFLPLFLPGWWGWGMLGIVLLSVGEVFFLPFNNAIALNMAPESRRGEYSSWYWMAWSLVHISGPVVGLGFAGAFGFPAFWIFLLVLTLLSGLMHWRLGGRIF